MQAIVYSEYGPPSVLRLADVETPVPGDNDVLVRVRAASINPLDWHFVRGVPYLMRMMTGPRRPKTPRLGADVAGTVEAVGRNVTQFKPGDEVFGVQEGALGEYIVAPANRVAMKPASMTFEQAAAVPVAGVTAIQGVRDHGKVHSGHKVLINGAAGGIGTFAVQIAKVLGAEVTGVCSTRNVVMVRSLGADRVVDYTKQDFTTGSERYDFVFDNVGNRSVSETRRIVKPGGILISNGGGSPETHRAVGPLGRMLAALVISRFVDQKMPFFLANVNTKELTTLAQLIQAGMVVPVIDSCYPLRDTAAALRLVESGHARGKVIVSVLT